MKKCLPIFALIAAVILLAGCAPQTPPAAAMTYPFTVEGELTRNDGGEPCAVSLQMTAGMTGELEFLSPASLKGYRFSLTPEGTTLRYGDLSVPYRAGGLPGGADGLLKMFSVKEEYCRGREKTEQNSTPLWKLTYAFPDGDTVTAYLSADTGFPLCMILDSPQYENPLQLTVTKFTKDT